MQKLVLKRQEFLCAQIEECLSVINNAPPGKLEIYQNRHNTKWYVKPDDGERCYLPKKEYKTAKRLAEKRIAELRLSILEKELRATKFYLNHYPKESELNNLLKTEALFTQITNNGDYIPWERQPFASNPTFSDTLKYPSPSGHMLRSKSECLIDIALFHRNIPFRYENELSISGNICYPDFTIYNERTGEFKYWEHFGMMDNPLYRKKAIEKINTYLANGFLPGINIYFTYETQSLPLTMLVIDKVIDELEVWLEP